MAVNGNEARPPFAVPAAFPRDLASSAALRDRAAAHGVDVGALSSVQYSLVPTPVGLFAVVTLGDTPLDPPPGDVEGHSASVDALSGGMLEAATLQTHTEERPGLLPSPSGGVDAQTSRASALSALVGPGPGTLAGGAAAATGLALLVLLTKFLLVPLFTRLRRDRLLENPVRARLYERVRAEPGIHRAELIDFAGIGEGATRFHLRQLVSHKLVVEIESEGYARYFAAGEVPPDAARREALLRAGSLRAVYDLYAAEPGTSLREAGRRLGLSAPSVHRSKKRLEKAGLLPVAAEVEVTAAA
jgi:hypothetical protein